MKNSPFINQSSSQDNLHNAPSHSKSESTKFLDILKDPFKTDCERCSGSGLLAANVTCTTCKGKGKIFIDLL